MAKALHTFPFPLLLGVLALQSWGCATTPAVPPQKPSLQAKINELPPPEPVADKVKPPEIRVQPKPLKTTPETRVITPVKTPSPPHPFKEQDVPVVSIQGDPRDFAFTEGTGAAYVLENGLFVPYPMKKIFRGKTKCKRGKRGHIALDIAGVGKAWGVGTPIRAITRSKVTYIGRPEKDAKKFGRQDRRRGFEKRAGVDIPRSRFLKGYGKVFFFTKSYGSFRTGNYLVTEAIVPPLQGKTVRYMHMGAIRPDLKKGDILEGGEELGVMGATAVLDSAPHLHIDIEDESGERVDIEPLLGSTKYYAPCP